MEKNKLTRRQFVTAITVGTGTVLLGNAALSVPCISSGLSTDPFQIVTLGNSGLKTTLLGMGTGVAGGNRSSNITRAGKESAESLIRYAYDKGIRFFDCADTYGTHLVTANALKNVPRESFILCTKIWVGPGGIPEAERPDADVVVERFRKELNTDYLDLVQIHCMTDPIWTDKQKKQMDKLENLKVKKIIRAHGVSVHSLEAMEACIANPWIDVVHVRVNPFGESMDKENPDLVIPVIDRLHNAGKGVIGMKLIGNGKFRNDSEKIDTALKYVLGIGSIDMIIVGFEFPEQIDNYVGRVSNALKSN